MSFVERRRFLWILFLTGLAALALTAALTEGTTLARLTLDDLAQQATAIVRLRCLGSEARWEQGELWTLTRFEVLEREKGSLSGLITVHTIGGRNAHLHSRVDGVPVFHAGEEAYLFLWSRGGEPYSVLGWSQGTFRIARSPVTGMETVTQDSASAPLFDVATRKFHHGGIRNLPLPVFRAKLRKALNRSAL